MNRERTARALRIFARNPIPGRVKTRLIPALGAERATRIYHRLLEHALTVASALERTNTVVALADAIPNPAMQRLLDRYALDWHAQHGTDLGERMRHSISQALRNADRVVLVGSDCPDMHTAYLADAFEALTRHDVVLGPASDGGYVLIGARCNIGAVFADVPWSSGAVLATTRKRLEQAGLDWCELATLRDVDHAHDLAGFPDLLAEPS